MLLNFKKLGEGFPIIILHGLLGSLDNWQSIAKQLSENYTVYLIDQRNHGKSPHSEDFNYDLLISDLFDFFEQHQLTKAHILGHSMGGKTAMHFCLSYPEKVEKLMVADIAPSGYSDQHNSIFKALLSIDFTTIHSREEVQEKLALLIDDKSTLFFLMKGLTRAENNQFTWRYNVDSLYKNYTLVADFPPHENSVQTPTLFLKGANSNYINASNYSDILRLFPNHEIDEIPDADHWLHADNPEAFLAAITRFLQI